MVGDLLTTWEAGAALEAGGVRILGHRFSKDSHDIRDFLARNGFPARWLDVERDSEARELLAVAGVDADRLPVVLLEDGAILERPTVLELAERLSISGRPASDHYDLVIVGGGPAGSGRRGLRRVRGAQNRDGRARGARRAGGDEQPDRELPRLPRGAERAPTSRAAGPTRRAGWAPSC